MDHKCTVSAMWRTDGRADVEIECTCGWLKAWEDDVSYEEMASTIAQHIGS